MYLSSLQVRILHPLRKGLSHPKILPIFLFLSLSLSLFLTKFLPTSRLHTPIIPLIFKRPDQINNSRSILPNFLLEYGTDIVTLEHGSLLVK